MEKTTNAFGRFDVVSDDSDHHFLGSNGRKNEAGGDCFSNSKSGVYKNIMREWKTLEQNLPESIYVRVYERRIDLLRAAIVGAAGTPYHDGLFFFDIAFPSDYPTHPPKLHFHSFGLRLNPNLYANGKVCLSLLNTWAGKKREKWDPSGSTLLQVLLSIQALVLNEKPFFNEPGSAAFGRALFERQSRAYNEHVFTLTCYTSIYLIRRPPKNFEALVKGHFRERALAILKACNEYVNGRVRVGYYCYDNDNNNGWRSSSSTVKVSGAFKGLMEGLYPQLLQAFRRSGASLGNSLEHLELERKRSKRGKVSDRKNNNGIFEKVMEKIKKVLGWKNSGKKMIGGIEGKDRSDESA